MHLGPTCSCHIPTKKIMIRWCLSCNINRLVGKSYSIISWAHSTGFSLTFTKRIHSWKGISPRAISLSGIFLACLNSISLFTNTQPANYQARGPNGWQIQGGEMVLHPGNGMPLGRGPSPGSQNMTTQSPGVGMPQIQMMRGHLGNQFTEQGLVQTHQFPQPYGSQQMALAASGQEKMISATPRGDETASQTRYAQFQQVGIKVSVLLILFTNFIFTVKKKLQHFHFRAMLIPWR